LLGGADLPDVKSVALDLTGNAKDIAAQHNSGTNAQIATGKRAFQTKIYPVTIPNNYWYLNFYDQDVGDTISYNVAISRAMLQPTNQQHFIPIK
jgi:hypothetical protein